MARGDDPTRDTTLKAPATSAASVRVYWALALLLLAGCAERPVVPDGASTDVQGDVVLAAWVSPTEDGFLLQGILENRGDTLIQHRAECGHPWLSRLVAPNGTEVTVKVEDPCHDFFYDQLAPGKFLEFRHSWDVHDHASWPPTPSPNGTYTWHLEAAVVTPDLILRTTTTFVV